ncbi:MAG: Rpp14/Pop5 family protein [archaeon]
MKLQKKKLSVIPPTLRDKKRYVLFIVSKMQPDIQNEQDVFRIVVKNFEKIHGLFKSISANLTIISFNKSEKEILVRVNKDNLDDLLTSLFFLKDQFGLIKVKTVSQTIKKSKKALISKN